MRRRTLTLIIVCVIIHSIAMCAFAMVSATPNQKLALRTGPNTKYVELYTLPKDTAVTAIELEEGNGVTWVLLEYRYKGETVRGYTGLKRIDTYGNIPWANPIGSAESISCYSSVWAAPDRNAAYRSWVHENESVTLLDYEKGYAYIEFYDYDNGAYSRGYVEADMIQSKPSGGSNGGGTIIITPNNPPVVPENTSAGVRATPNQKLAFRTGPNTTYPDLFTLPQDTEIIAYEYEEGNGVTWVLVEFDFQGMRCRGYTGLKRMEVHGNIPWANHLWISARVNYGCTVLAAPSHNAYYRGNIAAGEYVSILGYEGSYAHIEYYDRALGMNSRGYVAMDALN